jgi:hypothetical protein
VAKANGPCFDFNNRWVDCGNGTVTDTATGLIWLRQANCFVRKNWVDANGAAAVLKNGDCGLADNSSPGDWRLPSKAELDEFVNGTPNLRCLAGPCDLLPFTGVGGNGGIPEYWSSSTFVDLPVAAWDVDLRNGMVNIGNKDYVGKYVWPVRGGP